MRIEGQAGPQVLADGAIVTPRLIRSGELAVSEVHGRYAEQAVRGATFLAATTAGVATSAVGTAATGIVISNPAGSGINVVILEFTYAYTAAPTAVAALVLEAQVNPIATATVHTTPLIVRPALIGGGASPRALVDSSATLGAAGVIVRAVTAGVTAVGFPGAVGKDEIAGAIVLSPGTALSTAGVTNQSTCIFSLTWEEVPV